jgi:hypothetical protein
MGIMDERGSIRPRLEGGAAKLLGSAS